MTKKDYVAIAEKLAAVKPSRTRYPADVYSERREQWFLCVSQVASAMASDNPRFDYNAFHSACEGQK